MRISDWSSDVCSSDLPCCARLPRNWHLYVNHWIGIFAMQPMSESTIAMISPPTTAARRATSAKVALFIPSLHGGGAERVMVSLANGLAAKGLDVDQIGRTHVCTPVTNAPLVCRL